jgi:hypothetical protein
MSNPLWLRLRNHPSLFCLHMHPATAAALLQELADEVERRGTADLDLDPWETADWLRQEAQVAQNTSDEWAAKEKQNSYVQG